MLLGAGALLLAAALSRTTDAHGVAWLWVYGGARLAIAGFMIDRDPPPYSVRGRAHLLLAALAFTAIAIAASTIGWHGAPGALRPLGHAVAASALATLLTRAVTHLRRVFGLVERLLYAMSIAWLIVAAIDIATRA